MTQTGYLAVDCEFTGKHIGQNGNDKVFSIGFSVSDQAKNLTLYRITLDITNGTEPKTMNEWATVWKDNGFELDCFDTFWKKHIDILNVLRYQPSKSSESSGSSGSSKSSRSNNVYIEKHYYIVNTKTEMSATVNSVLKEIETNYAKIVLLTDTIVGDMTHLYNLLENESYETIGYSRLGEYRSGFEIDSYFLGAMRLTPEDVDEMGWQAFSAKKQQIIDEFGPWQPTHDHTPENDAWHHLNVYFATTRYCQASKLLSNQKVDQRVVQKVGQKVGQKVTSFTGIFTTFEKILLCIILMFVLHLFIR